MSFERAVRLVVDEGKTAGQRSRDLDFTESTVRLWVERARADPAAPVPSRLRRA